MLKVPVCLHFQLTSAAWTFQETLLTNRIHSGSSPPNQHTYAISHSGETRSASQPITFECEVSDSYLMTNQTHTCVRLSGKFYFPFSHRHRKVLRNQKVLNSLFIVMKSPQMIQENSVEVCVPAQFNHKELKKVQLATVGWRLALAEDSSACEKLQRLTKSRERRSLVTQVYLFFSLCHFGLQVVALFIHFVDEGVKFSAGFLQTHRQVVEKRPSPGVGSRVGSGVRVKGWVRG